MARALQRRVLLFSLFSRRRAAKRRREIARKKARTRRIEEFQRKQYLECIAFIVLLLAGTYQPIEGQVWMKQRSSDWWERIVSVCARVNVTTRARPYIRYPGFGTGSKASAHVNVA